MMDTLKKLKKQRAELDKKIYMLEHTECPLEDGDEFWYVDQFGNIEHRYFGNHAWMKEAMSQGHFFFSEKEAQLESKRRNMLHQIKIFRDKCNGEWEADFEDFDRKYFIIFNADSGHSVVTYQNFYEPFNIFGYFKNESDVIKAIDLFGDEIKKLFVDCECD